MLRLLCEENALIKVKDGLYYDAAALGAILEQVRQWFGSHENLDVGGLKELLGLSRKYLIALLEYMDNEKITVRVGDQRRYGGVDALSIVPAAALGAAISDGKAMHGSVRA